MEFLIFSYKYTIQFWEIKLVKKIFSGNKLYAVVNIFKAVISSQSGIWKISLKIKHNLICYSPKSKEAFDNNVMWPSIYCVNLVAILKLSYPLKQRLPDQTCLPIYALWQVNRIRNWPYDFWEVEIVKSLQIQERQTTDAGQNVLNLIFNLAVDVVELIEYHKS